MALEHKTKYKHKLQRNHSLNVNCHIEKPKSLNLNKTPEYTGKLVGIKGQYLIFEDQTVFNIRANEGLVVDIKMS